uniref:Uncharacterized protein n=1 Tax=Medicago truncatula TaxID=3880 RepID=B7FFW4_MEDTR|nr:unknown [Medicago truncatula]
MIFTIIYKSIIFTLNFLSFFYISGSMKNQTWNQDQNI